MVKRLVYLLLLLLTLSLLMGCWNNRDLTEMSLATGIGIDKAGDKYNFSVQIVKPQAIKAGSEGGGSSGGKNAFVVVSYISDTIVDALRQMIGKLDHRVFYSTTQIILFNEGAAKEGIGDILDFLERDHGSQYETMLAIAKGVSSKEILETKSTTTDIPAMAIANALKSNIENAITQKIMVVDAAKILAASGKNLVLPTVSKNQGLIEVSGGAVFKKDKLVGYLNPQEIKGYLFATGKVKRTVINVPNPLEPNKVIGIEIKASNSNLKAEANANNLSLSINVKVLGNLSEIHGDGDLTKKENYQKVASLCNQIIGKEIAQVVRRCQKEYKSDIFGFGGLIYQNNLAYWKEHQKDWDEIFGSAKISINVETSIFGSGLISKPIKGE